MRYIAVVGSRGFYYPGQVTRWVRDELTLYGPFVLVSGGCKDSPDEWSEDEWRIHPATKGIDPIIIPADWHKHGRSAGFKRNAQLVDRIASRGGEVVMFWDGMSNGTLNVRHHCDLLRVPYQVHFPKEPK